MARLFFESSALVKRYIQETGTAWVDQLLNPTARHLIHVARLTGVEIISAIARRVRTGTLQPAHQAGLVAGDVLDALPDALEVGTAEGP